MNFFSNQEKDPLPSLANIPIKSLNPGIMVSNQDDVQAGFDGSVSKVSMSSGAIGIDGVHMKVNT